MPGEASVPSGQSFICLSNFSLFGFSHFVHFMNPIKILQVVFYILTKYV